MAKETHFSNNPQPEDPKPGAGAQHPPAPEGAPQGDPTPPAAAGAGPHRVGPGEHAADPDSAVNLGATAPGGSGSGSQMDMSGVSAIEWAALVEEGPGVSGGPEAQSAPSDADLRQPPGAPPASGKETLDAIDLFAAEAETAAVPPGPPAGQRAEAADLDVLDTLVAGGPGSGSGVGSAVDYGANPPTSEQASSGVDLFDPGPGGSSLFGSDVSGAAGEGTPSESGIDLVAEDVILEESADVGAAPAGGEAGSARDLIAEAVESGVDLGAAGKPAGEPPPPELGEASDVISLEGPPGAREESSAVDLGAVMAGETAGRVAPPPGSGVNLGADVPAAARPGSVHDEPSASTVDLGSSEQPGALAGLGSGEAMAKAAAPSDSGINFDVPLHAAPGSGPSQAANSGIDLEPVSAGALAAAPAAGAGDEGVIAEEAEEEPAGAGEDERRPPPPRQGSRGPAWVGGGVLGALAGVVGCVALWLFGVQPPESWRLGGGGKGAGTASAPVVPRPNGGAAAPAASSFADAVEHLRNGEFEKAGPGMERIDENKPEELAARGERRWWAYIQKQQRTKAPLNANDDEVKQAVADLTKASNADALITLGEIQELTGKPAEARDTYTKAAERFKDSPRERRRFEAHLQALDESGPAGAGAALPRRGEAALLALALITLQPPAPMPQPGQPEAAAEEEAGYEFWQALGLARQQKYAEAVQALEKARALHEQRRLTRLRKAQNPLSDPTEKIFLRSCEELKRYWEMEELLRKGGYLPQANRRDPVKVLDGVIAAAKQGAAAGAAAKAAADRLLAERKAAETKAAGLQKMVQDARNKAAELDGEVKKASAALAKADADLKAGRQRESGLKASGAAAEEALKKAADELVAAKYLDAAEAKDPRAGLPKGLAAVIRMANAADPSGALRRQERTIADLRREVGRGEAALRQRWRPEEMLSVWLPLLQKERGRKDLAAKAALDADRVAADPGAPAAAKARAEVIRGLALRNGEKFAEARTVLQKARLALGGHGGEWQGQADSALQELADPGERFVLEANALERQGKWADAVAALNKGMASAPAAARGRLLARRALLQLEAAKAEAKGPLQPNDPRLAAARRDAEQAAARGEAEGHFAAGRIAEELGQWDVAAKRYRQAVAAHPELDAAGGRYRVALARVLLQGTQAEAPAAPAPPRPTRERPGRVTQAPRPLGVLAVLLALGLQPPPGLPPPVPEARREAERLADEVLAAPEGAVPFDVRAQALAIKGLYTRALTAYAEGLRPYLPARYAEGLLQMVRAHPGLSRPDSRLVPDPLLAEKHYAAGLNFYFARNYRNAEKELLAAVENDSQDARFYYYLGLSRLLQNKRGAAEDFEQGARLEAQGRPAPAAVSAALERVQGPARRRVNEARTRPPEVVGR